MQFLPINMDQWPRTPYFQHYTNEVPCTFSMTADIDISELRRLCSAKGVKLYPALVYLISRVVNNHDELRTCRNENGDIGIWAQMWPDYTIFHKDDNTFSSLWTPFESDFAAFYERYLQDYEVFSDTKGLWAKPKVPAYTFSVSCIPWVRFRSFNLQMGNIDYLKPIFTVGRYVQKEDRTQIPIASQFHHAVCDGWHAGVFYNELQALAAAPADWMLDIQDEKNDH